MSILYVILILLVIGFVMYVIERYAPVDPIFKKIIYFIVLILVIIWLLNRFGLVDDLPKV